MKPNPNKSEMQETPSQFKMQGWDITMADHIWQGPNFIIAH